ncbi:MAG: metal-dependent hydrolase [Chitinophagaceae bacterium]|jgi:L-ascorbate metabolism protein UlaG (beta-lactamase superfamily)|nr:metal-dependent hydrolase [Chitinophagaceae bacterium]
MKYTYYGHSCFMVETEGKKILFDPFITHNELAKHINIAEIEADLILVSHGHVDHIADCVALAQSTGALVVSNWEICQWLGKNGVMNNHPMNTGGQREFLGIKVRCVVAQHSSCLPDGSNGGNPMGFIVSGKEGGFYYSGDTALTLDMQLVPKWAKLNFAILPIGDNFTMGYEDAVEAAYLVDCKHVIGVHYDSFGYIKIDHEKAVNCFKNAGCTLHLPSIGETINI